MAEHAAIADATLARDTDLACRLLRDHYQATAITIRRRLTGKTGA